MNIEIVWFGRILQIATIIILGGVGMCLLLTSIKERPDAVWEDDGMHYGMHCTRYKSRFGWKDQVFGACCIVAMFVALFLTERTVVKYINPDAWEFSTRGEKIEMLHKDIQSLKDDLKEQEQ